jgi:hypothetical protein
MGQLEALFTPQSLDLFVVHTPALDLKKPGDLAVAIPAIALCQLDQRQAQVLVVALGSGLVLAGGPSQADRFAGSPFGGVQALANMDHRLTEIGRRQALGFK